MAMREQLLEIPELNIAQILLTMGHNEFDEYVKVLNSFVEKFPTWETDIKNALGEKDYLNFIKNLANVKDLLEQIHADGLVEDCMKQLKWLTNVNYEKLETFATHFLSVLTMLSIDIQMAILKEGNSQKYKPPVNVAYKPVNRKTSILAVDDSAFILGVLKTILQGDEYKLTCVTSGKEALIYIQNHNPDLFILDIEMPKIDGYELARKIKERGHAAPIIFLTANATKEYVIQAANVGAVDFIVKPVDKEQVLERIARHT
jgi:CheY-like chemotaxis protein